MNTGYGRCKTFGDFCDRFSAATKLSYSLILSEVVEDISEPSEVENFFGINNIPEPIPNGEAWLREKSPAGICFFTVNGLIRDVGVFEPPFNLWLSGETGLNEIETCLKADYCA